MNKSFFTGLFLCASFLTPTVYAQAKPKERPPEKVSVEQAITGENTIKRIYVGQAEAMRRVTIIPRVSGYIDAVPFQEGSVVEEGDVLFEIEKTKYQATVNSQKSKLKQLDAEIAYAKSSLNRQEKVLEKKAISKDEVENSLSLLEKLLAQKSGVEADLIIAEEDLKYCTIRSPFKGRVGRIAHPKGQYITTNDSLVTLTEENPIYVTFTMSENDLLNIFGDINKLKELAEVEVYTANEKLYEEKGTITITDNQVDPTTDTLKVWATFKNDKTILQPGSILTVHVKHKESQKMPSVPMTAVMHDADGAFVFKVNKDNIVERQEVTPGEINGYQQSIYSGVNAGETVVTDGVHKIKPGMKVDPVQKKSKN